MPTAAGDRARVQAVLALLFSQHFLPFKQHWIINARSTMERAHAKLGISHCLSRSRPRGHWVTSRGRWMTLRELARLQGLPDTFKWPCSVVEGGQMVGNAMAVDVLVHLLPEVFRAASLM